MLVGAGGALYEGLTSNFFAVVDGAIYTAGEGVLAGTVRPRPEPEEQAGPAAWPRHGMAGWRAHCCTACLAGATSTQQGQEAML